MSRLQEIKERERKATSGPWSKDNLLKILLVGPDPFADYSQDLGNAQFIAHSRADIPWLLDKLEQARAIISHAEFPTYYKSDAENKVKAEAWIKEVEE